MRKKIIIASAAIILLIIAFVLIWIWGTVEVRIIHLDYDKLQKRVGDMYIVPDGLEEYSPLCKMVFPDAEEGSKHRYAKYNNFTVRDKYCIGYELKYKFNNFSVSVSADYGALDDMYKTDLIQAIYKDSIVYYDVNYDDTTNIYVSFDIGESNYTIIIWNIQKEGQNYTRQLLDKFI